MDTNENNWCSEVKERRERERERESNPAGVTRLTGAGSMDTNLYRPATTCNMNMPVYAPFSTSASNKFIQKHHIITHNPYSKCHFKTHLDINYCFLGDIAMSTTKLSGTVGNILKNKSITKSKLFSSEQSKERVECTSLSPPCGTSTSIYRSSTTALWSR